MSNNSALIKLLFDKYAADTATSEEIKQLFKMISEGEYDDELKLSLMEELNQTELADTYDKERWANVFNKIKTETELREYTNEPKRNPWIRRISIAASIAIGLSTGAYFIVHKQINPGQTQVAKNDVAPGKYTATLTLAGGSKIILAAAKNGVIANQSGINITKTANGAIIYRAKSNNSATPIQINTLSTANGETYQVDLPDGTKAWLNAASSLKYPTSFANATQRKVELTGEGYFEVAKDKVHPFIVETPTQEVTVLGTHFNINAYADEPSVKTTLLEGSVQVTDHNGGFVKIKPGEQAVLKGGQLNVSDGDEEAAVAWKNGDFIFKGEGLETAMLRVARWYNVEVVYDTSAPRSLELGGWVSRSRNISAVLKMMASTGEVHFKVEGRRVLVTK